MAAVAVPVVIHLWNVRPSKTLKVGSIALLGEASRQTSKSLRISEWLLLLLRCLFIAVLAILLAQPVFYSTRKANRTPWLLVQKDMLQTAYSNHHDEIDSLLATGSSLHALAPGFPLLELSDTTGMTDTATINLPCWQLLKVLDHQIADSLPVYVYTANQLASFTGERPALQLAVHWRLMETGDSTLANNFLAFQSTTDSLVLLQSISNSNGNFFTKETVSAATNIDVEHIEQAKKICIYHNKTTQADARYLQSALGAISQFTQFDFLITTCNDPIDIPAQQDVIFWLSEDKLDATVDESLQPGGVLFYYGHQQAKDVSEFLVANHGNTTLPVVAVYKSQVNSTDSFYKWNGTTSGALLSASMKNNRMHYQFNSRLHPAWNNLVWEDDFPRLLLSLLFPEKQQIQQDLRNIATSQAATHISTNYTASKKETVAQDIALSHWFWLAAFLLLVSERWLSWRKNNRIHAG